MMVNAMEDKNNDEKEWEDIFGHQEELKKVDLEEFIAKEQQDSLCNDNNEIKQKQLNDNLQKLQQHEDNIKNLSQYTLEKLQKVQKIYQKLQTETENQSNNDPEDLKQKFDSLNNKISKISLYQSRVQFTQHIDSNKYINNKLFKTFASHQYDPLIFLNQFDQIKYTSYSLKKYTEKQEATIQTFIEIENDIVGQMKAFNGVLNNVLGAGVIYGQGLNLYDIEEQKLLKIYKLNQPESIVTYLNNQEFEICLGLFNGSIHYHDFRCKLESNSYEISNGDPIIDLINHENYTSVLTTNKLIGLDKRNPVKHLWDISLPQEKRTLFHTGDLLSIDMQTYYHISTGRPLYLNQFCKTLILSQFNPTIILTPNGLFSCNNPEKAKTINKIVEFDNFSINEGELIGGREDFCILLGNKNGQEGEVRCVEWKIEKQKEEKVKEALIERLTLGFDQNEIGLF